MRFLLLTKFLFIYLYYFFIGKQQLRRHHLKTSVASLGGVYVKMMQFLTLQTAVFSQEDKLEFLGFYDQVSVQNIDLEMFLKQQISPEVMNYFSSFENVPFASGSFGQVYKAVLRNGQQVVIKVKRQNLEQSLFFDFLMIKIVAWLASFILDPKIVNIQKLVREFESITWKELDYEQEVENALFLYEFYKNHPVVVVPYTYKEFSNNTIITQDYVGGVSVTDLLHQTLERGRQDKWLYDNYNTELSFINKNISYSLLEQSFLLDRFYSDPHPGNIKILPHNQFAFIDFGIMSQSPPNRKSYHQILKILSRGSKNVDTGQLSQAFFEFTANRLLRALETCDDYGIGDKTMTSQVVSKYQNLIQNNKSLMKKVANPGMSDYSKIWRELLELGEQFRMQLPAGVFAALKSAFLIKSFTSLLQPDVFVMKDVYREVTKNVNESILDEENLELSHISNPEVAFEVVADWLSNLIEYDPLLYQKLIKI